MFIATCSNLQTSMLQPVNIAIFGPDYSVNSADYLTVTSAVRQRPEYRVFAAGCRDCAGTCASPSIRDELTGLAEDFNRLAAALERNEELLRRGMADVSHELRTPMAVATRAELDALIRDKPTSMGFEVVEDL